jgi:hypothetical protein
MALTQNQKELLAVAAVGLGLSLVMSKVPLINQLGIAGGALLYVGGYVVAKDYRPAGGWPQLQGNSSQRYIEEE